MNITHINRSIPHQEWHADWEEQPYKYGQRLSGQYVDRIYRHRSGALWGVGRVDSVMLQVLPNDRPRIDVTPIYMPGTGPGSDAWARVAVSDGGDLNDYVLEQQVLDLYKYEDIEMSMKPINVDDLRHGFNKYFRKEIVTNFELEVFVVRVNAKIGTMVNVHNSKTYLNHNHICAQAYNKVLNQHRQNRTYHSDRNKYLNKWPKIEALNFAMNQFLQEIGYKKHGNGEDHRQHWMRNIQVNRGGQ